MDYGFILWAPVSKKTEKMAAEKPLKTLTKMAFSCKSLNYWERLKKFRLFSNERRMERYKCFYIWKSLNGLVPSLGLEWVSSHGRIGPMIKTPPYSNRYGAIRTIQRNSMMWEGVRIYNSLPEYIRTWTGTKEGFKNILDKYLELIPDQPEQYLMKPGGKTVNGDCSNSIADWSRVLDLEVPIDDEVTNSIMPNCNQWNDTVISISA